MIHLHHNDTTSFCIQRSADGKTVVNVDLHHMNFRVAGLDANDCRMLAEMLLREAARQTEEARRDRIPTLIVSGERVTAPAIGGREVGR